MHEGRGLVSRLGLPRNMVANSNEDIILLLRKSLCMMLVCTMASYWVRQVVKGCCGNPQSLQDSSCRTQIAKTT